TELGDEDARAAAFDLLELRDELARFFHGGVFSKFLCVDSGYDARPGLVASEGGLHRVGDLPERGALLRGVNRETEQVSIDVLASAGGELSERLAASGLVATGADFLEAA